MIDTSDDIHETRLREEIGSPAPNNPAWARGKAYHASDVAFLLRRLDEVDALYRAEFKAIRTLTDFHYARVTELLEANTREVERRRTAEAERDRALEAIRSTAQRIPKHTKAWYRVRALPAVSALEAGEIFAREHVVDKNTIECVAIEEPTGARQAP